LVSGSFAERDRPLAKVCALLTDKVALVLVWREIGP